MTIYRREKHRILFCRQLRFSYLNTLDTATLYPYLSHRVQMPTSFAEDMHMATVVVDINRDSH